MSDRIMRKDYIDGKATFEQYYGQFQGAAVDAILEIWVDNETLLATDGDLSKIPLELWSKIPHPTGMVGKFKEVGDSLTTSGKVCLYKEAARLKLGL